MNYPEQVKSFLWSDISKMSECPERFAKNPYADFSRKRKLDFENLMRFLISMESGTTEHELLKYFDYDINNVLSNSAFYQQRKKLLPNAFAHLLFQFNSHFPFEKYRGKYQLAACDGSEFNIARNPDDPDTFYPSNGKSTRGFNMIHTISFYDILNKRYLDCIIQSGRKKNEFQAICDLIDRYSYEDNPIFIADRGFSSYNFFAHAMEKGVFFIVRAKDINVKRLLNLKELPDHLDTDVDIILTRTQSKNKRQRPEQNEQYRYISSEVSFDYIEPKSTVEYPMHLRIVRFEVAECVYENIITNLPDDEFSPGEIKQLYHMRWSIETSFRDLKHTIGTINFHSKKVEYIEQEIWARLILFNFCAIITTHVVIKRKDTKHVYQINFAMAMKICHHFIRLQQGETPPDVEGLIGSYMLPIRPGRVYAREHRFQRPAGFGYRFS
ncbi:MAG: IS4 family transposase [Tissierellia bacterium]|jgi:hypothetical protein|nr:IS4 family transposase [Tissierellia bacterium]